MASPKTLALKRQLAENHAASLAKVTEELGLGPVPRKSHRWIGYRTKGMPYANCRVVDVVRPAESGRAAVVRIQHATRKTRRSIVALTPEMMPGLYPELSSLPDMTNALLGRF